MCITLQIRVIFQEIKLKKESLNYQYLRLHSSYTVSSGRILLRYMRHFHDAHVMIEDHVKIMMNYSQQHEKSIMGFCRVN